MRIAVITGASSGMGREFALQITQKYRTINEIWLIARSKDKLELLALEISKIRSDINVRILNYDITDEVCLNKYLDNLKALKPSIRILVNAAGAGIIGSFDETSQEDNSNMIDLNCKALVSITKYSLPFMSKSGANIINIASAAAYLPQPSFAIYAASKSFVLSFSRALNKELKDRNIAVTAMCPGPVDTAFFDGAQKYHEVKTFKKAFRVSANKVVKLALKDAYHCYPVSTYGIPMKLFRVLCKAVPKSILISFIK